MNFFRELRRKHFAAFLLGVLFWTAVCFAAFVTFENWGEMEEREILTGVGRTVSELVLGIMRFNSEHGGVYVVAGEGVEVDGYFRGSRRDLSTVD